MNAEEMRHEIVMRHQQGQSLRAIARALGVGRNRVKRTVRQCELARGGTEQPLGLPGARQRRASMLDDYESTLQELLERYPQITAVRMHEELRASGFQGQYTIVRERLKELRPKVSRSAVQRFETLPGQQAQMDWAQYDLDFSDEGRRRVYLFSYVLGYSRRQYLCFCESQDFSTTIRQHVRAFEHLGGVAATCLYDNMKVVVTRHADDEPVYNTRFLAFATHYGFRPIACAPRRPETKGKVERNFFYVETSLLNGRTFRSLAHLQEVTQQWLAQVADLRVHRHTCRRPLDLHTEELPHLIPLPANPYDVAEVVYRAVDCEGFVAYRQNQYSVPWKYVGRVLPLRITEQELIVYSADLHEIARHYLLPRSITRQQQVCPEHHVDPDRQDQVELLGQLFSEFGEVGQQFLAGLMAAHRQGKAQARHILALRAHYHQADLLAALERAVRYGAFSANAVERILAVQAQPKSTLEMLADKERQQLAPPLKDASVPPRSTADYEKLLFQDQSHEQAHEQKDVPAAGQSESTEQHPAPPADPGTLPNAADSDAG